MVDVQVRMPAGMEVSPYPRSQSQSLARRSSELGQLIFGAKLFLDDHNDAILQNLVLTQTHWTAFGLEASLGFKVNKQIGTAILHLDGDDVSGNRVG